MRASVTNSLTTMSTAKRGTAKGRGDVQELRVEQWAEDAVAGLGVEDGDTKGRRS
jgi:hypothetical protein